MRWAHKMLYLRGLTIFSCITYLGVLISRLCAPITSINGIHHIMESIVVLQLDNATKHNILLRLLTTYWISCNPHGEHRTVGLHVLNTVFTHVMAPLHVSIWTAITLTWCPAGIPSRNANPTNDRVWPFYFRLLVSLNVTWM